MADGVVIVTLPDSEPARQVYPQEYLKRFMIEVKNWQQSSDFESFRPDAIQQHVRTTYMTYKTSIYLSISLSICLSIRSSTHLYWVTLWARGPFPHHRHIF